MKTVSTILFAVSMLAAGPAFAGEITGSGKYLPVNGNSQCAYSGLNDTPDGFVIEVAPGVFVEIDPGGKVQSYGYFMAQKDFLPNPSDPAARDRFAFPAVGCNPNGGPGGH